MKQLKQCLKTSEDMRKKQNTLSNQFKNIEKRKL